MTCAQLYQHSIFIICTCISTHITPSTCDVPQPRLHNDLILTARHSTEVEHFVLSSKVETEGAEGAACMVRVCVNQAALAAQLQRHRRRQRQLQGKRCPQAAGGVPRGVPGYGWDVRCRSLGWLDASSSNRDALTKKTPRRRRRR